MNPAAILKATILIVDDQAANVSLLVQMLQGAGYAAIASTMDPREVCALHRANRYDLILLDLQMPAMDGFEVMEGLKEIESNGSLPVLVITAEPDHKLRALQAGRGEGFCLRSLRPGGGLAPGAQSARSPPAAPERSCGHARAAR